MPMNPNNSLPKILLAALLLSILVLPGFRPIFKYLPHASLLCALYVLLVSILVFTHPLERFSAIKKILNNPLLSFALIALVGIVCWFAYPFADGLKLSMRGSDQDDCIIQGSSALIQLAHSYLQKTYFGNPCSPGPGLLILYIPFVWLHLYILGAISAIAAVAYLLARHWQRWDSVSLWLITLLCSLVIPEALVVGSDLILPACLILAIALLLEPAIKKQEYFLLVILAIATGLIASIRINFIVFAPLVALFIFMRWRVGAVLFSFISLAITLVPGYFIYQLDPASFTPLHLVSKSAKFIPTGLLICTGLASIGIALYCAYRLKKGSNNFPIAIFLSLAPMLLMASIGELAYGQWAIAGWAGANYLIPLIPLAAYLLIDITQRPKTYQGARD